MCPNLVNVHFIFNEVLYSLSSLNIYSFHVLLSCLSFIVQVMSTISTKDFLNLFCNCNICSFTAPPPPRGPDTPPLVVADNLCAFCDNYILLTLGATSCQSTLCAGISNLGQEKRTILNWFKFKLKYLPVFCWYFINSICFTGPLYSSNAGDNNETFKLLIHYLD